MEKAIELNDKDVFAWEQLGRLHVQVRACVSYTWCVLSYIYVHVYRVPNGLAGLVTEFAEKII